jgi:hypothetical protein
MTYLHARNKWSHIYRYYFYFESIQNKFVNMGDIRMTKARAIAQAVSRLPTTAAQVRAQVRSCEICGGQNDTGVGFLRVLRFPLPIFIPPTAPHSSSCIIRGWYDRPISGRRTKWTQVSPHPKEQKRKDDHCSFIL